MAFLWAFLLVLVVCDPILVVEVCRHGARAPSEVYAWNQHHWAKKDLLQLTNKGRDQHRSLGRGIRASYPDLIDKEYDWRQVQIFSTDTRRTIESALEQMVGLFPMLEYDVSDLHQPYLKDSQACYPVNFTVKSNGKNTLLQAYRPENCPRMRQIMWRVMRGSNYQEMEVSATDFQRFLQPTDKNLTTLEQISEFSSNLKCDLAEGVELPTDLKESLQHLMELEEYYRYTVPFADKECLQLTCSEFFTSMLADMESAQQGSGIRFALYSAHEMTVGAFLACLHLSPQEIPDFASSLFFELHSDQRVVVRYNNKLQRLKHCPEPCRLSVFKQALKAQIVSDLPQACRDTRQVRMEEKNTVKLHAPVHAAETFTQQVMQREKGEA